MRFFKISLLSVFLLVVIAGSVSAMTSSDLFPIHASMRPNVEFWKKIYSKYPSTNSVLHDRNNLNIIYEIIELEPHGHGSSRINSERIKKAKKRYQAILDKLAGGKAPSTKDERRVYAMFGPNPKQHEFRQAKEDIRSQTGQKDRFLAGLKRSGKYLERIKDILRNEGIPEDLAYLPHVESSYNYEAYSKFGAAGIWQFTRSTGQNYMQVDYVVDERRDPIVASHAAAKFLKKNHELLGSWPLALTAYNHGPNGMLRAKKEKGSYTRIFDEYNGTRFKFASRNFYACFIAATHVAKNYKLYFGNVSLDRPVQFHTIEMEGYASVASICEFFHVSEHDVKKMNPALRPPVFDGQKHIPKGYRLCLPGQPQKMARMSKALPSSFFEKTQKRSRFYRVQRGDTAGKIARRHNVSINELVAANSLTRRATIYVGQNLRIPDVGERATMLASATTSQGSRRAELTMATLKKKVLAKATAQEIATLPVGSLAKWRPQGNPHGMIAAREEDTAVLTLVARAEKKTVELEKSLVVAQREAVIAGVPVASPPVAVAKGSSVGSLILDDIVEPVISASMAEVGLAEGVAVEPLDLAGFAEADDPGVEVADVLVLEGAEAVEAAGLVNPMVLVGNFDVVKMKTVKGTATGTIQVEVEETLGHYADWLEIPTSKIRSLNRYPFGRSIHYGQKLQLPFGKISKEDFEEKRYLFHKELVEDFFVAFNIDGEKSYRVKKGDNLWTLCSDEFELPFWLIKQYNAGFDFHALRLGAEIKVPMVSKIDADSQVAEVVPGRLAWKTLVKNISPKKLTVQ